MRIVSIRFSLQTIKLSLVTYKLGLGDARKALNWTEPTEKVSWAGPAETKESWAGPAGERTLEQTLRSPGTERPLEQTLRAPGTELWIFYNSFFFFLKFLTILF